MRNNNDFFHGTDFRFAPGDLVMPNLHDETSADDLDSEKRVFSTRNPHYASTYGKYTYQVEPTEDEVPRTVYRSDADEEDPDWTQQAKELYGAPYDHVTTAKPMRVVKQVKP